MIRTIIENFLLFLLPTVIYVAIAFFAQRRPVSLGRVLNEAPMLFLAVVGASLVGVVLAVFGQSAGDDGRPGQAYEPAASGIDGKVVPGRMK